MQNLENLRPRSYLRRAILDQHNLILLVGAVVLAFAFASPLPLSIGACAEVLFLLVSPRIPAFRAFIDRQDSTAHRLRMERSLSVDVASLEPSHAARFAAFSRLLHELSAGIAGNSMIEFEELDATRAHFEQLSRSLLGLMLAQQGTLTAMAEIPALELSQEVARLERAFASQRDLELRMGLRQQMLAAQKRLSQREELEKTSAKLELELSAIEKSVGYLTSHMPELVAEGRMLNEVRALVSEVSPLSGRQGPPQSVPPVAPVVSIPPGLAR